MTSNGKSEASLPQSSEPGVDYLSEIVRETIGEVIAIELKNLQREHALKEAEAGRVIAELRAEVISLRVEAIAMVAARLADLHDGKDGSDGKDGEKGDHGIPGEAGAQGPQGERGETGPAGPAGQPGAQGDAGIVGDPGPHGPEGPAGPIGPQGERGEAGAIGIKGDQGERGEQGATGEHGEQGIEGVRGEKGDPGASGQPGGRGEKGDPGEPGAPGQTGAPGIPGAKGDPGSPGKLPIVKAYKAGAVHYEADCVMHAGATYQAMRDTATAPPSADWNCLARAGLDALTPTVRGTWLETETYSELDVVALEGSSFIARKDGPGVCPGDDWQMITSRGRPGKEGKPGARGERGEKGVPGEPAPTIIGWKINREDFTITPIVSDGGKLAAINLHELFEQFQAETR